MFTTKVLQSEKYTLIVLITSEFVAESIRLNTEDYIKSLEEVSVALSSGWLLGDPMSDNKTQHLAT